MATSSQPTLKAIGQVYLDLRQRRLRFLNEAAKKLRASGVPFTASDLAGQQLQTLDGRPVRPGRLPLVLAYREARPIEADYLLLLPNKPPLQISWSAAPQRDAEGKIIGVLGSLCCRTPEPDWKALAGLAHDLSTPLHALQLWSSAWTHLPATEGEWQEGLEDLRKSIHRALEVSKLLLEHCRRPVPSAQRVTSTWFALEPLLEELFKEQQEAARRKALPFTADLSAAVGREMHSDPVRLGRLLANLLVNAVRYTSTGSVAFQTSWRRDGPEPKLALSVVDTGVGISAEEQESIFQPFERGQAARTGDSGGSGLGLAVVDQLVSELELELEVFSEYGRGSTFHLLIPGRLLRSKPGPDTAILSSQDTSPEIKPSTTPE